jgi:hypothetical protein
MGASIGWGSSGFAQAMAYGNQLASAPGGYLDNYFINDLRLGLQQTVGNTTDPRILQAVQQLDTRLEQRKLSNDINEEAVYAWRNAQYDRRKKAVQKAQQDIANGSIFTGGMISLA